MRCFSRLLAASLLALPLVIHAAPDVRVVGLFAGAAVLVVDGERKLVRVGDTGPHGVVVVSADPHQAVLRIDGVEKRFGLTRDYSEAAPSTGPASLSVARGNDGHYRLVGTINGQSAQFLVDTGATSVAMNEDHARRIGIDYRVVGRPIQVSTASGVAKAWRIRLDRVQVGEIQLFGVDGVVVQGNSPVEVLLGMSFLNRVRWGEEQGLLRIEAMH